MLDINDAYYSSDESNRLDVSVRRRCSFRVKDASAPMREGAGHVAV